ncbi:MAG: hypothetical protein JWR26_651 [Pedosphaera sp.]|nr:hypothetical protein [Pedosphaera sp.]
MKTEFARFFPGERLGDLRRGVCLGRGWQELNSSSPQPSPPPKRGGRSLRTATGEGLLRSVSLRLTWRLGNLTGHGENGGACGRPPLREGVASWSATAGCLHTGDSTRALSSEGASMCCKVWDGGKPSVRDCPELSRIVRGYLLFSFFLGCPTLRGCLRTATIWAGAWKQHASSRNLSRPLGVIYFFISRCLHMCPYRRVFADGHHGPPPLRSPACGTGALQTATGGKFNQREQNTDEDMDIIIIGGGCGDASRGGGFSWARCWRMCPCGLPLLCTRAQWHSPRYARPRVARGRGFVGFLGHVCSRRVNEKYGTRNT